MSSVVQRVSLVVIVLLGVLGCQARNSDQQDRQSVGEVPSESGLQSASAQRSGSGDNLEAAVGQTEGGQIAFVSDRDGNREIYIINADGTGGKNLSRNKAKDETPSWSPDGQQLAFTSTRDYQDQRDVFSDVYLLRVQNGDVKRFTEGFRSDVRPGWSHDGRRIAFVGWIDMSYDIGFMNLDGSGIQRMAKTDSDELDPAFSPDGKYLVFTSRGPNRDFDIVLTPLASVESGTDTGRGIPLAQSPAYEGEVSWHPDNEHIAFVSERDGNPEIYVVALTGAANPSKMVLKRLTHNDAADKSPSWSPDGKHIVFASERDGNSEIYVVNADGDSLRRLTNNSGYDGQPAWRPMRRPR